MDPVASGAQELAGQVDRLAQRLRSLSQARLARSLPGHDSAADAAHLLAQRLADASARLEDLPPRPVPRLHDLAVGDQLAVTGHDLVVAAGAVDAARSREAVALLAQACQACRDLAAAL